MHVPASAGRRLFAAPLLVLSALLALLTLVIAPATPAHSYNGSTSACSPTGTTGYTDEGQQNNISSDPTKFQYPTNSDGTSKTIHVGLLYVDFPDAQGAYANKTITDTWNRITPAANWMWNASYGKTWLSIAAPYNGWLRMPSNSTAYGWERGLSWSTQRTYVKDALNAAASAGVDLSQYDMFYIAPSANAAAIGHSPTFIQQTSNVTWIWNSATSSWVAIHWAVTLGQDVWGNWGYKIPDHETGHTFGLPDLYAFADTGLSQNAYVGGWDIMGNISGPGNQYFGWQSWKLGFTRDNQVDCITSVGTTHTGVYLDAVENRSSTYKKIAVVQASSTTAYVVESRRNVTGSADTSLCSTGALIYLVDWSVTTGHGPIRTVVNPNHASPGSGCTWIDMDTWQQGQSFSAWGTYGHITISVTTRYSGGDTVTTSLTST